MIIATTKACAQNGFVSPDLQDRVQLLSFTGHTGAKGSKRLLLLLPLLCSWNGVTRKHAYLHTPP